MKFLIKTQLLELLHAHATLKLKEEKLIAVLSKLQTIGNSFANYGRYNSITSKLSGPSDDEEGLMRIKGRVGEDTEGCRGL